MNHTHSPGRNARLGGDARPATTVRTIAELCAAGGGAIDADTYVGEASWRAALHGAGAACEMTRSLLAGEVSL